MNYTIKNLSTLKKILWVDAFLGGATAIIGLAFFNKLADILGLSKPLILIISIITFFYAVVAFVLVKQKPIKFTLLRALIYANWIWTLISIVLFVIYYRSVTTWGLAFLTLQVLVVGGLAYLEGGQMLKTNKNYH